jgi:hypothetical protein
LLNPHGATAVGSRLIDGDGDAEELLQQVDVRRRVA